MWSASATVVFGQIFLTRQHDKLAQKTALKRDKLSEMSEQDSCAILKNILSVKQLFTIFCDF